MRRLLFYLLGLLGFVAASCDPQSLDMYGASSEIDEYVEDEGR